MTSQFRPFFRKNAFVPFAMCTATYQQRFGRNVSAHAASGSSPEKDITIYQYKICPYCSRPKTFLDYLGVTYKAIEVNPLTKSQLKFSGVR